MPRKDLTARNEYMRDWRKKHSNNRKAGDKIYRETHKEERAKYVKANFHNIRNNYLVKTYGITLEDYNKTFNEQEGKCAICHRHQSTLKKPLCVDHNHKTGKIRALLCNKHNLMLGQFADNADELIAGGNYLKKYE